MIRPFSHTAALLSILLLGSCGINNTAKVAAKAAEGDPSACYEYGHRLLTGRKVREDRPQAIRWLRAAAAKGSIRAAAALGACYAHGLGTKTDTSQARYWYGIAAEAGHPHAQLELASHYMHVEPVDPAAAVTYIRYAAMQGSPDAAFLMSLCFAEGYGVRAHQGIAVGWLVNAAKLGHQQAIAIINDLRKEQEKTPSPQQNL